MASCELIEHFFVYLDKPLQTDFARVEGFADITHDLRAYVFSDIIRNVGSLKCGAKRLAHCPVVVQLLLQFTEAVKYLFQCKG